MSHLGPEFAVAFGAVSESSRPLGPCGLVGIEADEEKGAAEWPCANIGPPLRLVWCVDRVDSSEGLRGLARGRGDGGGDSCSSLSWPYKTPSGGVPSNRNESSTEELFSIVIARVGVDGASCSTRESRYCLRHRSRSDLVLSTDRGT